MIILYSDTSLSSKQSKCLSQYLFPFNHFSMKLLTVYLFCFMLFFLAVSAISINLQSPVGHHHDGKAGCRRGRFPNGNGGGNNGSAGNNTTNSGNNSTSTG